VTPRASRLIRAEIDAIVDRFDAADQAAKRAATLEDREAAEAAREDVEADLYALGEDLADLLLLLIRYASTHRREALEMYLAELLRPQLDAMARSIATLEARCR
jgi:hypothetical protein